MPGLTFIVSEIFVIKNAKHSGNVRQINVQKLKEQKTNDLSSQASPLSTIFVANFFSAEF